jgi:hypothetical protein
MVFALNPNTTGNGTFEQFLTAAEALNFSDSSSTGPSSTTVSIIPPSSGLPVSGSTTIPSPSNTGVLSASAQSSKFISSGAIAGIVAGCIASLLISGVVMFYCRRRSGPGAGLKPRPLRILPSRNYIASAERPPPPAYHTIYRTDISEPDRRSSSTIGRSDLGLLSSTNLPSALSSHASSRETNGIRGTH